MVVISKNTNRKKHNRIIYSILSNLKRKVSPYEITWEILGGKRFMPSQPTSHLDLLTIGNKGIPKLSVVSLSEVLDIPMKDIATLPNISLEDTRK
jgi:hypothetical protein